METTWKEALVASFKVLSRDHLEGLRKTLKHLTQNSQSPIRQSNPGLSESEAELLSSWWLRSTRRMRVCPIDMELKGKVISGKGWIRVPSKYVWEARAKLSKWTTRFRRTRLSLIFYWIGTVLSLVMYFILAQSVGCRNCGELRKEEVVNATYQSCWQHLSTFPLFFLQSARTVLYNRPRQPIKYFPFISRIITVSDALWATQFKNNRYITKQSINELLK